MNASELREKNATQLHESLHELLKEQFSLRMQKGIDQLNRHTQLQAVRRNIARVKTILHEKGKQA
jgi:large subunit ribosomal protein L29